MLTLQWAMEDLNNFIEYSFSIIIGIEFVKMVCKPTASNIIEVLTFAVARFLIIDHSSIMNSFLGAVSIAILFTTKKYLLSDVGDLHDQKGILWTINAIYDKHKRKRVNDTDESVMGVDN